MVFFIRWGLAMGEIMDWLFFSGCRRLKTHTPAHGRSFQHPSRESAVCAGNLALIDRGGGQRRGARATANAFYDTKVDSYNVCAEGISKVALIVYCSISHSTAVEDTQQQRRVGCAHHCNFGAKIDWRRLADTCSCLWRRQRPRLSLHFRMRFGRMQLRDLY